MSAIERVETPISMPELERRWAAVRKEMAARNIDALITQNSSDWLGGYVKWFTDIPAGPIGWNFIYKVDGQEAGRQIVAGTGGGELHLPVFVLQG